MARYAAERDLPLGIEAVNRYESYPIDLAEQLDDTLDSTDEPNVFAQLDTCHMTTGEKASTNLLSRWATGLSISISPSPTGHPRYR